MWSNLQQLAECLFHGLSEWSLAMVTFGAACAAVDEGAAVGLADAVAAAGLTGGFLLTTPSKAEELGLRFFLLVVGGSGSVACLGGCIA